MSKADDVARLRALAAQLEQERGDSPPSYQPAITLGIKHAQDLADALEDGDDEGAEMAMQDVLHGPLWLRHDLSDLLGYLKVVGDPPIEVWIRWDQVPEAQRAAAVSLANLIVNAMRGRWSPGGRPRN